MAEPIEKIEKKDQAAQWWEQNNRFHEALVQERGEGWQAFWGSQESQTSRYDVFLRLFPLSGATVLDVGCGFGDFFAYAEQKGVRFARYLGVDLDDSIAEAAGRRHPGGEFRVLDVLSQDPPFRPDFIVASGIMAVNFDGYEDYVLQILRRFHALCGSGFALNFLSACSRQPNPQSHYVEASWVMKLFQAHVDWRCLVCHDYRPNDFTFVHLKPAP